MLGSALAICWHDLARLLRNPGRMINIPLLPLLIMVGIGTGYTAMFRDTIRLEDNAYQKWIAPGFIVHILMFSARNSASMMMRDRDCGLLQVMLLCSRRAQDVLLGKVLSGTIQCVAYGYAMIVASSLLQLYLTPYETLQALWLIFVVSLMIVAGFFILATVCRTHEQFIRHSQLITLAMFFTSGSLFPITVLEPVTYWVGCLNPTTYLVDGLRNCMLAGEAFRPYGVLSTYTSNLQLTAALTVLTVGLIYNRFPRWVGMS
jgi:ABC-2 type transport system permease protein